MNENLWIPTEKFDSKIVEVTKRLTAAYENMKLRTPTYNIAPDENFIFEQDSFDEFTRQVCEEHYCRIYSKRGLSSTFLRKVKGDFREDVVIALGNGKSDRLKLLLSELRKLT